MSVPGFVAAACRKSVAGGGASAPQAGASAWMPGVTSPFFNEFPGSINAGTSQSTRQSRDLFQSTSGAVTAYKIFDGETGLVTPDYKYVLYAHIWGHVANTANDGIRGLYLAYFSADENGDLVFDEDDETMLTRVGGAFPITAQVGDGFNFKFLQIEFTNSNVANTLDLGVYMTTIARKVGQVAGGG